MCRNDHFIAGKRNIQSQDRHRGRKYIKDRNKVAHFLHLRRIGVKATTVIHKKARLKLKFITWAIMPLLYNSQEVWVPRSALLALVRRPRVNKLLLNLESLSSLRINNSNCYSSHVALFPTSRRLRVLLMSPLNGLALASTIEWCPLRLLRSCIQPHHIQTRCHWLCR